MRTRKAPLKGIKSGYGAADTTVVVLTCIPSEAGYYEERLDVLKVCLASIRQHTDTDFDLMVVDNGSAPKIADYLLDMERQGHIDHLVLNTRNLGLSGALNVAFNAAPGKYIAFSNDDVFFYPNWLSKHIEVLEAFPNVGMVTGLVISGPDSQHELVKSAGENGTKVSDFYVPDEWVNSFAHSVGLSMEEYLDRPWAVEHRNTYLLESNGIKAFSGKTGFSHVFRKDVLQLLECFPFETGYMAGDGTDRQMALDIGKAGLLWLCTYDRTTAHLGNMLDAHWLKKLERFDLDGVVSNNKERPEAPADLLGQSKAQRMKRRIGGKVVKHPLSQKAIGFGIRKLINLRY